MQAIKKTPEKPGFSRNELHEVARGYPQGEANIQGNPSEIHEVGTCASQNTAQHGTRTEHAPTSHNTDLAKVIDVWPSLSEDTRATILQIVAVAGGFPKE